MAKKLVDYHIHTGEPFLDQEKPHATGTWSQYFKAGNKLGLIPGNSNHPPHYFGKKDGKNLHPYEKNGFIRGDKYWEHFLSKNLNYRKNHKNALLGLEVEYFEDIQESILLESIKTGYLNLKENASLELKKNILKNPFDYIILSNHFVFGRAIDYSKEEYLLLKKECKKNTEKIIKQYWNNVLATTYLGKDIIGTLGIKTIILGHLDLIKMITIFEGKQIDVYKTHQKIINKILHNIKDFNLMLEYNTAGIKKRIGAYPDKNILIKAKKLGIKICFGSDSHHPYEKDFDIKNISCIF